ncbi:hypothetical protein [Klebsiella pneumoniae]|uniref:hypothetical protein n=1 Tax=Klebsiella pneumoniae TaxID=573 RepID=UPI002072A863|nr:hypothetical protein [Klebsiella pneumoniae]
MSEFSRETLLNIIETDHVQCGEASSLARMALAAMDSEPVIVVGDDGGDALSYRRLIQSFEPGTKLYRHAQQPVVPGGWKMVPIDATREMIDAARRAEEDGYDAMHKAMLAAAPHDTPALNSVQSVVTVPGKLIPVSEQKPDCWCLTCRPVVLNDMRFVVCPDCGNKRCPRANDHRNACTGSNRPGQEGSAYPAAPQEDINALIPLVSRNEQEVK